MSGMADLARRSLALALAYLLALQVLLAAWDVLTPAALAGDVICTTQADGTTAPAPDHPPQHCAYGPLCGGGGCAAAGVPAMAATKPIVFDPAVAPAPRKGLARHYPRRLAGAPEQARAPPVHA
jgi:hypothetical protein